ncbi:MAG: hypothetical protein AAB508_01130 [Patescibacteria group bacterium]
MPDPINPTNDVQEHVQPNIPVDVEGVDLISSILNEQNQPPDHTVEKTISTIEPISPALSPLSDSTPVPTPPPLAVLVRDADKKSDTVPPPPKSPKKSKGVSVLIAGILVLLLSLPLVVSFMNQKKQTSDVRSKAAQTDPGGGPYPGNCMNDCFKAGHDGGYCTLLCNSIASPTSYIITPPKTASGDYDKCLLLYSKTDCDKLYKTTTTPSSGGLIAWQPCNNPGAVQEATCMDGQTSTRYICQGDKGWQPDLSAPACKTAYCAWPRNSPNDPCCPPASGVDSCNPSSNGGTDLYKCIPDPFISKCTWIEGCGGGYWKAEGWTESTNTQEWKDFEAKCGIKITTPPKITPASTLPPGSTGTPPPGGGTNPPPGGTGTPPPPPGGQCTRIKVYKDAIAVDPKTLKAGDAVVLAVAGANASKGRIRVNGGSWNESSTLNAQNEYTVAFTIPTSTLNFSIEAEVLVNGAWK